MRKRIEVSYEIRDACWGLGKAQEEEILERCVFPTWASALTFAGELAGMTRSPGDPAVRLVAVRDLNSLALVKGKEIEHA